MITKTDIVEQDWLELVKAEVGELVAGTVLQNAPMAEVSGITGQGIPELTELIALVAGKLQERPVTGQARMAVDRVFSVTGFGTVVTGTLAEGRLTVGDRVEILPQEIEARVRGLQVHSHKVETAEAGQRVAVNLAGIECEEIERGSVLAAQGFLKPSHRFDIRVRLLDSADKPLVNRARVRVHVGTAEILARIVLLETDELNPGETGLAQLECEQPTVAARGDRVVIRSYSPMRTIGGGIVIDSSSPKHKRFNQNVINAMATKEKGTPEDLVGQFMISSGQIAFSLDEILKGVGYSDEITGGVLTSLVNTGVVRTFAVDSKSYYVLAAVFDQKLAELANTLKKFHADFPLRPGMSKEEVRSKHFANLNNKQFNALVDLYVAAGDIRLVGESLARDGFFPGPGLKQKQMFESIEHKYLTNGLQTPGWDEITTEFRLSQANSEEILSFFVNSHVLVKLDDGVLVHRKNLDAAKEYIINFLHQNSEISLGEARDFLKTSRKFALPIMSYFDKEKITRRVEDKRVLY